MSDPTMPEIVEEMPLGSDAVSVLAEALRGPVLTPADPGYDDARVIWTGSADKRPAIAGS